MKGGGVRADGTQWKQRPPVLFNADGSPMTEEQKEKVTSVVQVQLVRSICVAVGGKILALVLA